MPNTGVFHSDPVRDSSSNSVGSQALLAKDDTREHANKVTSRARRVFNGCGFFLWSEISASRAQRYLAGLREREKGIGAQTFNFYLQAVKQFCRCMVRDRRASESPVEHLAGLNVKTDRRHDRRALSVDESRRLVAAAQSGAVVYLRRHGLVRPW